METSELAMQLPGTSGARRIWSVLRTFLALLGFGAVLAVALASLPGPREALMREILAWADAWEEPGNVSAGTILPGTGPAAREQRAVTEFLSKRYRVALDATAGYVQAAYHAGSVWKVDPLLILAVAAVESRYNPVAESPFGAKGLMQVIPRFHKDKLPANAGKAPLLDPVTNVRVGSLALEEAIRRNGYWVCRRMPQNDALGTLWTPALLL